MTKELLFPESFTVAFPSKSVIAPLLVPFSITVAPMTVSPVWSVTVTFTVCAETQPTMNNSTIVSTNLICLVI